MADPAAVVDLDERRRQAIAATADLRDSLATDLSTDPGLVKIISEPGVYEDIPELIYHADPVVAGSLSSTGARKLMPPSCPALFRYEQDHPVHSDVFDFGKAAHQKILGIGPEIVEVKASDWRTKAAQQAKIEARKAGNVALLTDQIAKVNAMAEAIHEHPMASTLLTGAGWPERSLFWVDEETGVWRRSRIDWFPDTDGGRVIFADYKTADSANPKTWAKSAADYGYHQQAAFYEDAVKALGLAEDPAMVFVIQEKKPPYLVSVVELDVDAMKLGRNRNHRALWLYRECVESGRWPPYSDEVEQVSLPAWVDYSS